MPVALHRDIRKILEGVVKEARIAAEAGALTALRELGVADTRKPTWLTSQQADLRVRLRAHARSLGDPMDTNDASRLQRLIREIAYAHWHRALFARFLLENGLLVDVEADNVPVRASELHEIAEQEGRDVAEVAAEFAEPILPQIFPTNDPVLALALPPETRQEIMRLTDTLPAATFEADDSLGWTYQFWQADRKKQVNDSEVKIGADELPAVTQLFTEDYMVLFLIENTLGAWWAGKKLAENPGLAQSAVDEDELRRKLSLPDYAWTYLRFTREGDGTWRPAAGIFPGWPTTAAEITVLDPCMGSGHFLVFALAILVAFRKAEERLDEEAAVMAVLRENLYGLEVDPRCTQIGAFALALMAWKRVGGVKPLPKLNLACSGLAIGMGKAEFVRLAEKVAEAEGFAGGRADLLGCERNPMEERALARRRSGLDRLYDLFAQASVLGSLIDPRRALGDFGTLFEEGFDGLSGIMGKVLERAGGDPEIREVAVTAEGLAKAADLLGHKFTLVTTNVPYLGRGRQNELLKNICGRVSNETRGDLAYTMYTVFSNRSKCLSTAMVLPHNWLFLTSYEQARRKFLKSEHWNMVVRLGAGAFETISGEVVAVYLGITSSINEEFLRTSERNVAICSPNKGFKPLEIANLPFDMTTHSDLLSNPGARVYIDTSGGAVDRLKQFAAIFQGSSTGDADKFERRFWEFGAPGSDWAPFLGPARSGLFSGREAYVRWDGGRGELAQYDGARIRGREAWGQRGLCLGVSSQLFITVLGGEIYNKALTSVVFQGEGIETAFLAYAQSGKLLEDLRRLDQKLLVAPGAIMDLPFDLAHWQRIAQDEYPEGLPRPHSNDPTQWLFDGHPRGSADPNIAPGRGTNSGFVTPHGVRPGVAEHPLQVAVTRLLGYRWPRQTGSSFMDCPSLAEIDEIDRSGLVDPDGIVCLPALHGEASATDRMRGILRVAWGEEWSEGIVRTCLEAEGTSSNLETWLRDEFFDGHCRLFHQTPFIWQVWDGLRDGFSALVNYHKLCDPDGEGRRLLEKLRDTYLGEWIARQRRLVADGDATAEDRLAAADHLSGELAKIIEGEPPYDIFVRWKPVHKQPIGWEPDIDDGVRVNIRPFLTARPRNARGAKACILRVTPVVKKHAGADRGKEPFRDKTDYPWFWAGDHDVDAIDFAGGAEFQGRRYNDFHYTRRFKRAARNAKRTEAAE